MEEQDMDICHTNRWISWFGSATSASWLISKKIISYHELKQVTKVFAVDLSKQEKDAFLLKKQ